MQLKLANLAASLLRVDNFYDSLGGLAGYQLTCLQLCAAALEPCPPSASSPSPTTPLSSHSSPLPSPASQPSEVKLHMPLGVDLAHDVVAARRAAANGLTALPYMAEIYPLGGAGDRLGLKCEVSGDCLPTAMLQYCGRTLLEGLVRDLQVALGISILILSPPARESKYSPSHTLPAGMSTRFLYLISHT